MVGAIKILADHYRRFESSSLEIHGDTGIGTSQVNDIVLDIITYTLAGAAIFAEFECYTFQLIDCPVSSINFLIK